MTRENIALGGVLTVGVACAILGVLFTGTTTESTITQEEPQEQLTPVEIRRNEIMQSDAFQDEMRLRATARAMFEESQSLQEGAVHLAEKALETYRMAQELDNQWKINQTTSE